MPNSPKPARLYSTGKGSSGLTLYFPVPPETIPLARESEFVSVKGQVYPDGCVHNYQGTSLLTVPLTFKVNAQDDRCVDSPIELLYMAAALHAFVLPMATTSITNSFRPAPKDGSTFKLGTETGLSGARSTGAGGSIPPLVYPPACVLDLVTTSGKGNNGGPGIRFYGYVKSVEAKLMGPWLQVEDGQWADRNLPSRAEFSLTFVHAPSYQNVVVKGNLQTQAEMESAANQSGNAIKSVGEQ